MFLLKIERVFEKLENKKGTGCTLSNGSLYNSAGELVFSCHFIEPAGPDTIEPNNDKRIPEGTYKVEWLSSTTSGNNIKGKLPLLYNDLVSKNRRIRIHIGNTTEDTEGCILPGLEMDTSTCKVYKSKAALTQLLDITFDRHMEVQIINRI